MIMGWGLATVSGFNVIISFFYVGCIIAYYNILLRISFRSTLTFQQDTMWHAAYAMQQRAAVAISVRGIVLFH